MANEKFWFVFEDEPTKKYYIDEPINYDEVDFSLDQKDNGMGRDVSISGGEINFRFTIYRQHYLEKLLYSMHKWGFESDIKLFIKLETGEIFKSELDFYTATTNDYDYLECSVILESELQIFKRRSETKVDLFSSTTIDGEYIEPLQPINMLLQAKPAQQISEWVQTSPYSTIFTSLARYLSITQSTKSYGIDSTFTPLVSDTERNRGKDFMILDAANLLKNTILEITNVDISYSSDSTDVRARIYLLKAAEYPANNPLSSGLVLYDSINNPSGVINTNITYTIGDIQRGEKVWLFLQFTRSIGYPLAVSIKSIDVKVTADAVAYNSISPTFRLIDVMRQVSKSIAGIDINAPRYDNAGQFYDTVITNGKLLGGNVTDPFYISWQDIEKSIYSEHNADSEIGLDGRVFVGIEEDYYQPIECGFIESTQFSNMLKKAYPKYCINKFTFKYSKYQSLKEATEPNSESTIHGESQLTPYNKKVENTKECNVQWTRDAILLDVQQRLSTKVSDDTTTQDDDTLFAIDTIVTDNDKVFSESTMLQHKYSNPFLSLRNDGEVNFLVLGIRFGSSFVIDIPDKNSGNYTVLSVTGAEVLLQRVSGGFINEINDGLRLTKYTYTIAKETIPLTNRTNEGFAAIDNLSSANKYSNLRYSVQRNIRNYWDSYLATVNMYWKDRVIKNTYYKNNGKCITEYNGLTVTEKEDFIPTAEPLVTPIMYENVIFANVDFSDFLLLQYNIRQQRGYIRTIDNNQRVLKLFPIKMSYQNKSRQLTISGQEKYEKTYLKIISENGVIIINDETTLPKINYEIEDGNKVVLFDKLRQRLYNGVYWDKVTINGANAETINILKEWLDLLG